MADLQFACKAGTTALQAGLAYVGSGLSSYGLAVGADTAQSRPGDVLEFTAGAGAAAFFLGNKQLVARLIATTSYVSDTPDFWRRPHQSYPEHAGRFTGDPAYFHHVESATQQLLKMTQTKISDYTYCIFHTPNGKFPALAAKKLGCTAQQMRHSLIVSTIGNTYAAASLLALVNVLDHAQSGETILLTSYGSGAGADSFAFTCTSYLPVYRRRWHNFLHDQMNRCQLVSYDTYRKNTI
jgi:hydroxymethylglutaryl-CoA synthase